MKDTQKIKRVDVIEATQRILLIINQSRTCDEEMEKKKEEEEEQQQQSLGPVRRPSLCFEARIHGLDPKEVLLPVKAMGFCHKWVDLILQLPFLGSGSFGGIRSL